MTDSSHPRKFGNYSVQKVLGEDKPLGEGSYGITFLVRDSKDRPLALKWLKPDAPDDGPTRFKNEAAALAAIDHRAFPRLIAQGKERGRPYIVMSYVEGNTLAALVEQNSKGQGFFSGMQTLVIAQRILDGLSYIHSDDIQIVHRDIKEANVVMSLSGDDIAILDLGQNKDLTVAAAERTFWNIGAARFAPPTKLENPSIASKTHDVFAVGVLCYRMLTNRFPWEVSRAEDVGHLKQAMLDLDPVSIRSLNSNVNVRIHDVVMRMLETADHLRITADEAKIEIEGIKSDLENEFILASAAQPSMPAGPLRLNRVALDPLHGDIQMSDFEFKIINTKEFQRLRRLRQLGTTHLVYPGAEHSRFSHALGTLQVTEKILTSIEKRDGMKFDDGDRQIARAFSLVHDITHAPFGHTLEDELGFFRRHDANKARMERLIYSSDSEIAAVLMATDVGRKTLDLVYSVEESEALSWVLDAVSSSVGADVIDYVNRDAYFCGLDHRIDSAIFRRFALETSTTRTAVSRHVTPRTYGSHGIRIDAEFAIASLLRERYALFMKVYSHPTKVAAGAMVGKALLEASRHASDAFAEEKVECMGDDELLFALGAHGGERSAIVIDRLMRRQIYKPVYAARVLSGVTLNRENFRLKRARLEDIGLFQPDSRRDLEASLAQEAQIEDIDIILYGSPKAPGAQTFRQRVMSARGLTDIRDDTFEGHQEIYRSHLGLWNGYLFARRDLPQEKKMLLGTLAHRLFGIPNEVALDRRQLALEI